MSIWTALFGERQLTLADPVGWRVSGTTAAAGKPGNARTQPCNSPPPGLAFGSRRARSGHCRSRSTKSSLDGTRKEASDHWLYSPGPRQPQRRPNGRRVLAGASSRVSTFGVTATTPKRTWPSDGRVISLTPTARPTGPHGLSGRLTGARRYRYSDPWGTDAGLGGGQGFPRPRLHRWGRRRPIRDQPTAGRRLARLDGRR